jgi:hypothetical protein
MDEILKEFKIKFQLVDEEIGVYKEHKDWFISDVEADEIWCNTMTFLYKKGMDQINTKITPNFMNEIGFNKELVGRTMFCKTNGSNKILDVVVL